MVFVRRAFFSLLLVSGLFSFVLAQPALPAESAAPTTSDTVNPAPDNDTLSGTSSIQDDGSSIYVPDTTSPPPSLDRLRQSQPRDTVRYRAALDSLRRLRQLRAAGKRPLAPPDSITGFLTSRRIGVGIGWSLGGFPLYEKWQDGLPDSLGDFNLSSRIDLTPFNVITSDSSTIADVDYRIRERPDAYNVHFPINFSFTPYATEKRHLTLELGGLFSRKVFLGTIRSDSLFYRLDIRNALWFYTVSLGASFHQVIPEKYFRINNVDQTAFSFGVDFHPLSSFLVRTKISFPDGIPDSVAQFSDFVQPKVENRVPETTAYGMGASWRVGLSTISVLTSYQGLRVGIYYVGRAFGGFRENGASVNLRAFSPENSRNRILSIGHQIEIRANLLRRRKPEPTSESTPSVSPASIPEDTLPSPSPANEDTIPSISPTSEDTVPSAPTSSDTTEISDAGTQKETETHPKQDDPTEQGLTSPASSSPDPPMGKPKEELTPGQSK